MLGSASSPTHDQVKKVQFIFAKMDSNNDGTVSLEEFIEVCTRDQQLAKLLCIGTGMPAAKE
jgi:Ca2+-binding EF-hand superfamily protein